jgi:hypothetical protein
VIVMPTVSVLAGRAEVELPAAGWEASGEAAGAELGLVRFTGRLLDAEAEHPGGVNPDYGAAGVPLDHRYCLSPAADFQEPHPPRVGGHDVVDDQRGLAVPADVAELLAGRQVEVKPVKRACSAARPSLARSA